MRNARGPRAPRRSLRAADLLRPTFKSAIWSTYDHIGLLVLANLIWLVLCLPVVTAPVATAGLFHLAREIARGNGVSLRDFFSGFRSLFLPAVKLGLVDLAVLLALWINVDFYSHLRGGATIPGMVLAAAMVWTAAFFLLMHAHLYPLLTAGETSLRQLLRKSALLTLDNLAFTIGITLQALSLSVLCIITGAGLVLINGSAVAVLLATGHRELLRKYSDDPDEPDEPRQFLETRTLRDLWKPWESGKRGD
ncbi:MAG: YesL family protein [Candidatus Eisenbacteria bacterium]